MKTNTGESTQKTLIEISESIVLNPNPSLAKNSLMTVIRNAASIDKAFSYVS
jgi:hypothetical protein